jgi:hypothetical protein
MTVKPPIHQFNHNHPPLIGGFDRCAENMKWLVALLLLSGCLFWLFHEPAPSEAEVVGLYAGTYKLPRQ